MDNKNKNLNKIIAGKYPFLHGIYPHMYLDRLWTMRQYSGFSSAKESNQRFRYLLNQGVTGLSVAFDLPTQTGYDSDHELSIGEVGKVGVPISTLEDMETLLKDIPLDKVSISMTINSTAAILLAFLIVIAEKRNIPLKKLRGTIQNDILKEYIARGTFIFPPKESMNIIGDLFEYTNKFLPKWKSISISGYHIREAGSNAIEELAFTMSNAIEYINTAKNKGLDINQFGEQISFFFNSHNNFFEEISKFRAARVLWARIMKEKFNVSNPKAMMCKFHTQTAGSTLQAQQVENNIVRTTLQAAAAVLGGTQSLHTNSYDEALSLPTQESAQIALRTQQIIAYESGITNAIDPLAGSYYVETLTDTIIKKSWELMTEIENLGGAIEAIHNQFQENRITESALNYQQDIDSKLKIIVGLNKFKSSEKEIHNIDSINQEDSIKQLSNLKKFKLNRDSKKVDFYLNKLEVCAKNNKNIMPEIINCVRHHATLGEIVSTLKLIYGEHLG